MNDKHYVSLKIAKRLKEVGVEFADSEAVWMNFPPRKNNDNQLENRRLYLENKTWGINRSISNWIDAIEIPAPSLSEILDELPFDYGIVKWTGSLETGNDYYCYFKDPLAYFTNGIHAATAPDAAALMLIKLHNHNKNPK